MPTATSGTAEITDVQKSIFNAPPSSIPTKPAETNGLKPAEAALPNLPKGVKRPRDEEDEEREEEQEEEEEEEEEEVEDAPMEEDDESDAPMEASSSDED